MKKKILEFKTVSPLYEMERDGKKYFTERLIDYKDPRFRALFQWNRYHPDWLIQITNPATGEHFVRHIINVSRIWVYDRRIDGNLKLRQFNDWLIIEWDFREVADFRRATPQPIPNGKIGE